MFAAAAVISFAASIPISVNGWGCAEIAAVFVLGSEFISAVPGKVRMRTRSSTYLAFLVT